MTYQSVIDAINGMTPMNRHYIFEALLTTYDATASVHALCCAMCGMKELHTTYDRMFLQSRLDLVWCKFNLKSTCKAALCDKCRCSKRVPYHFFVTDDKKAFICRHHLSNDHIKLSNLALESLRILEGGYNPLHPQQIKS